MSTSRADVTACDVVVVGAGLAGLTVARQLKGKDATIITAAPPGIGGSSGRAKGGVAAAVGPEDSPERHVEDTLDAGAGLCDREAVETMVERAPVVIRELESLGVGFDRTSEDELDLGREAAHSRRRIVHAGGDESGVAIVHAMIDEVLAEEPTIDLANGEVVDLCVDRGEIAGVVYRDPDGELHGVAAPAVVLATGGLGGLYRRTTNPEQSVGRGLALAFRAGAELANLEFVQFHPTALHSGTATLPLLSEALRGEGARLVDESGTPFMERYDERGDLAPRDVVARAVWEEMRRGHSVYLDIEPIDDFRGQFPSAAGSANAYFGDRAYEKIPVTPAAHYHMGGVVTDLEGRTSVDGLWACGEVAETGVHGANRLASNSMLECLVFGERAGRSVADCVAGDRSQGVDAVLERLQRRRNRQGVASRDAISQVVRDTMWESVGIVREGADLREAAQVVGELRRELSPGGRGRDAALVSELAARSALRREESRGAHYRRDFPERNDDWRGKIVVRRADEGFGDFRFVR